MAVTEQNETPFHLKGNYAPVTEEVTALDLPVQGAVPEALEGLYVRNGANPKGGSSGHWFFGDGMLHGIRLRDGNAEWYRNRYVRTKQFEGADRMEAAMTGDLSVSAANTHVIGHAGKILALEEGALPTEMSVELETLGVRDYDGRLGTAMTAHPKLCAETGELHFFGYAMAPPYLTYHRADAAGNLVQSEPIDIPASVMMHDFAISRNYAIFLDLPVVFDLERAMAGTMPFRWGPENGARIGLLPRRDGAGNGDVQWFEVEPNYVFHTMNAFDLPDGRVVLDAGRHAYMWKDSAEDFAPSLLHRWTLDPATGSVAEEQLDDAAHGFPRVDDRVVGLPNRYGWAVQARDRADQRPMGTASVVTKYDLETGTSTTHDFGKACTTDEPVFVPAGPDAAEDEGFVLSYVYDADRGGTDFVVLDAADMSAEPVAVVPLPQRVPHGFHGSWIPTPS